MLSYNNEYAWSWSEDVESGWNPGYKTEQEAIEEAKKDGPGMEYVWIADTSDVDVYGSIDADYVIENIAECSDIDLFDYITDECSEILEKRLNEVVEKWIEEFKVGEGFFHIRNIRKVWLK